MLNDLVPPSFERANRTVNMHSRGPTEQSSDVLHLQGTIALECSTLLLPSIKTGIQFTKTMPDPFPIKL